MRKRDRRALTNNVARFAEHFLKLQYSTAKDPLRDRRTQSTCTRSKAREILADIPGLRSDLQDPLDESYDDGRRRGPERSAGRSIRKCCRNAAPIPVDQMLDQNWWP